MEDVITAREKVGWPPGRSTWSDVDSEGSGRAVVRAHHGEFLQGVFPEGRRLIRGLISVPCDLYSASATFVPAEEPELTVDPGWKSKARAAAVLALTELGRSGTGGHLRLTGGAPLRRGFGSSTSDVIATIFAVYRAFAEKLTSEAAAVLAVRAEQASDSLMFDRRAVLFAHLDGGVIEDFGAELPPIGVLGFGTSPDGLGVDTAALPPARYSSWEIEEFRVLRTMFRRAVVSEDVELLGRVASASAGINQRHLPVRAFDRLQALAECGGAIGLQVAHSGDIAGLLFDVDDPDLEGKMEQNASALRELGIIRQWRFGVGAR
ncbi:GHMP family kinase ATP-binding protein [Amycolatopsis sp. CA-230715]|uniref:GHMP family kinase ATP-binding protein n=1 Tax=Amycolatopsis sp. CA-230715 TaxID=2745196 RepID=UPI001C321339|nr:kinase [Amycolatopsis sp. CA-230715]QWF84503.1 hypothetical protein HUW46_07953 [Amycolatopsis sp. CA-230715]